MRHASKTLVLLAAAALAVAGCQKKTAKKKKADDILLRAVETKPVGTQDLVHTVDVLGEIEGKSEVTVFAEVPERIRALPVQTGDHVRAGQILAVLRGELQGDAVKQAEAGLEAATASADALRDQVKRVRALVRAGTASKSQLDGLEAQLAAAQAQVRQVNASLSQASTQKSRTLIRAPIAGVVAGLTVHVGDMAVPQRPLCTIVQDEEVKAVLRVPEREFLQVKMGMPATLSPLADPSVVVHGKVTLKGPVVDRMTRTGDVEIRLPNEDHKLIAGSAVNVSIEVGRKKNVVMVPASALIFTPDTLTDHKAIAFVVVKNVAHRRSVIIGDRQKAMVEIVKGLTPGEQLVTLGAQLLRNDNPVKVTNGAVGS